MPKFEVMIDTVNCSCGCIFFPPRKDRLSFIKSSLNSCCTHYFRLSWRVFISLLPNQRMYIKLIVKLHYILLFTRLEKHWQYIYLFFWFFFGIVVAARLVPICVELIYYVCIYKLRLSERQIFY